MLLNKRLHSPIDLGFLNQDRTLLFKIKSTKPFKIKPTKNTAIEVWDTALVDLCACICIYVEACHQDGTVCEYVIKGDWCLRIIWTDCLCVLGTRCILNSSSERKMCHLKVSAQYKSLFMHLLHMLFIFGGKYSKFARKQSDMIFPCSLFTRWLSSQFKATHGLKNVIYCVVYSKSNGTWGSGEYRLPQMYRPSFLPEYMHRSWEAYALHVPIGFGSPPLLILSFSLPIILSQPTVALTLPNLPGSCVLFSPQSH